MCDAGQKAQRCGCGRGFWINWDNVETDHQTDDRADTISWEEFQKFD